MRHNKITKVIPFILLLFVMSCYDRASMRDINDFKKKTIIFPELSTARNGAICKADSIPSGAKLVLYHGADECGPCKISHLRKYAGIAEKNNVALMIIFDAPENAAKEIAHQISARGLDFIPVYFDKNQSFTIVNGIRHRCFYSFIMDDDNRPSRIVRL